MLVIHKLLREGHPNVRIGSYFNKKKYVEDITEKR